MLPGTVAVLRSKKGEESIKKAIKEADIQYNKDIKYDFDFNTETPEKFYCTELVTYIHDFKYPVDEIIMPDQLLTNPNLEIIVSGRNGKMNK